MTLISGRRSVVYGDANCPGVGNDQLDANLDDVFQFDTARFPTLRTTAATRWTYW